MSEADTRPIVLSQLPLAPAPSGGVHAGRPAAASMAGNTRLLASRIMASVYSATGSALAPAPEVTTRSRSQSSSMAYHFTVPAA